MLWFSIGTVALTVLLTILFIMWINYMDNAGIPEFCSFLLLVGIVICVFVVINLFNENIKTAFALAGAWSWAALALLIIVLVTRFTYGNNSEKGT